MNWRAIFTGNPADDFETYDILNRRAFLHASGLLAFLISALLAAMALLHGWKALYLFLPSPILFSSFVILAAAWLGRARLIDNVQVELSAPLAA